MVTLTYPSEQRTLFFLRV
jgi:transposase